MRQRSSSTVHGLLGVAGLLCLLLLWWLGVHVFGGSDSLALRFSPEATLASLGELLLRPELYEHVLVSLKRILRMISPLSWMPVVVMLMGVGDQPIYFLLTFAAVWPILLNTVAGVRQLDPRWLQLSRSLSATRWETLRKVILPGVLGHVLTGVRLSIGILWIVLVPCEMLGVSAGLGYFILDTRDRLAYSELMAMVLLIGVLGFALDAFARWLHRRWAPA